MCGLANVLQCGLGLPFIPNAPIRRKAGGQKKLKPCDGVSICNNLI